MDNSKTRKWDQILIWFLSKISDYKIIHNFPSKTTAILPSLYFFP